MSAALVLPSGLSRMELGKMTHPRSSRGLAVDLIARASFTGIIFLVVALAILTTAGLAARSAAVAATASTVQAGVFQGPPWTQG
jgi:hypothetical protein